MGCSKNYEMYWGITSISVSPSPEKVCTKCTIFLFYFCLFLLRKHQKTADAVESLPIINHP